MQYNTTEPMLFFETQNGKAYSTSWKKQWLSETLCDNFDLPKGTESLVLLVTASYNIDRKPTGSKFWHINY